MWALSNHPHIEEDGGRLGGDLAQVFGEAAAVLVRRIVKPHPDAASLLGLLQDIARFYDMAKRCFPRLPLLSEVESDIKVVRAETEPVIAFVDEAYVHLDRTPRTRIWQAFTRRDSALEISLAILEKYINLLHERGASRQFAIEEEEIKRLFAHRWMLPSTEVPSHLTEGERLFGTPHSWDARYDDEQ